MNPPAGACGERECDIARHSPLGMSSKITLKGPAMRLLGLVIGALVLLGSAIAVVAPDPLISFGRSLITPAGLYAIAALRVALGLAFILAAPRSRAPRPLRILGALVIIAGLTTPWFGVARSHALLDWWAGAGRPYLRLAAAAAMAIGGLLVYAFRPPPAAPAN